MHTGDVNAMPERGVRRAPPVLCAHTCTVELLDQIGEFQQPTFSVTVVAHLKEALFSISVQRQHTLLHEF